MNKPYFGVTGAATAQEIKLLVELLKENNFTMEGPHIPTIGILVSHKTIDLGINPESRRYPTLVDLPKLLELTENKTFNTIHFSTNRPQTLHEDICRIMSLDHNYFRGFCHGIQFNMVWPPAEQIDIIKSDYPELKSILQLANRAVDGLNTEEILKKVKTYSNLDYILIDPSCGRGLNFNVEDSTRIFTTLKKNGIKATVGFAGGLSGENVATTIRKLKKELGPDEFCLDAEGNLREKRSAAYHDDYLSFEKVKKYIEEAAKAFSCSDEP